MDLNAPSACPDRDGINASCPCPKQECPQHGLCCRCIVNHKNRVQDPVLKRLPACLRDMVREALETR